MQKVKSFVNYLRHAKSSKFLVASAFALIGGGLITFATLNQSHVSAASNNDVMYAGAANPSEFVSKYNADAPGDLKTIYQNYGLSPDEISRFASTAKMGTAYKDGRVVVDGKTVATEANSLGRTPLGGLNNIPVGIGGKTYHWGSNSRNFGHDSIPAMVMMNPDTHEMEFAALTACGNPVWGKSPKYKCSLLNQEQVNRTTFTFNTSVVAENATVSKVVYDFGDGKTETRTNPAEKVSHTYAKAGSYTAKVTVYFSVNGHEETDTRKECTKPVEVKEAPSVACTSVTARQISRNKYEFTAHATASGGATLKDGEFTFGDDQSATGLKPATSTTVTAQHEYAKEGNYTVKATLNFDVEDKVQSKTCEVKISVSPEACPINPSVAKGSPECTPCPYNKDLPKNSDQCKQPETPASLPSTGPAEMIGSALGLGSIVGAGGYYFRTRRDLLSTVFKR